MFTSRRLPISLLFSFTFGAIAAANAAEKHISRGQLPEAVRKEAEEQAKGATVRGYTMDTKNGHLEYEVEMISNGHSKEVTISPDGRLIEIEEEVDLNSLPSEVISALRNKAGRGDVSKVESITKNGVIVAYEAQVLSAGRHSEIQVGPEGQALTHEE
jgi:hypothetical protein